MKKAVTKTVWASALPENCRLVKGSRMHPQDPSLPSRKAEDFLRFSRLPALRDRAYWSLKGRRMFAVI